MSKVLVIGDLHFSDVYVGHHKDYWGNCMTVASKITETIKDKGITHLFLTGDIVGYKEKNFKHRESLLMVMMILQKWNELTNGNVYSLVGNHDIGGNLTDFGVFESLGLLKTGKHLSKTDDNSIPYCDIEGLRVHMIDYGQENKPLSISTVSGGVNIGLAHADIQVDGKTTWWHRSNNYFELSTMTNWRGLDMIVAGHIHNPSQTMVSDSIDGSNVDLLYVGNPTRPNKSDTWDSCWNIIFMVQGVNITMESVDMKLTPHEELFNATTSDIDMESIDVEAEISRVEELAEILETLSTYKLDSNNDIESQIRRYGGVDSKATDLALEYLEKTKSNQKA